jgi:hypothetical protein
VPICLADSSIESHADPVFTLHKKRATQVFPNYVPDRAEHANCFVAPLVVPTLPIRLYCSWILGLATAHGLCSAAQHRLRFLACQRSIWPDAVSQASTILLQLVSQSAGSIFPAAFSLLVMASTSSSLLQFIGQVAFLASAFSPKPSISTTGEAKVKFTDLVRFLVGG